MRAPQSVSTQTRPEEPGIIHVRIDGITALCSGETQAAQALLAALPDLLAPRADVASGKFAACAAALAAPAAAANIAPDNPRALLAPLRPSLLPVSHRLNASCACLTYTG